MPALPTAPFHCAQFEPAQRDLVSIKAWISVRTNVSGGYWNGTSYDTWSCSADIGDVDDPDAGVELVCSTRKFLGESLAVGSYQLSDLCCARAFLYYLLSEFELPYSGTDENGDPVSGTFTVGLAAQNIFSDEINTADDDVHEATYAGSLTWRGGDGQALIIPTQSWVSGHIHNEPVYLSGEGDNVVSDPGVTYYTHTYKATLKIELSYV
jgi:hypothetical protein